MKKLLSFAAILASCLATATPVLAQEAGAGWKLSLTGYLWTPTYDNDITDSATGQASQSSAVFIDWVGNLRSLPLLVKGEVQYDRVGVIGDLIYLPLSQERTITRPILGPIEAKADVTTTTATVAGFYRAYQSDQLSIDLLGGFRYVKLQLDLQGPGARFSSDPSASFTEAIVGVRATRRLGARTSLSGYGDYGGFDGSRSVWQLIGVLNYQWTPKATAFAGWRHFVIDVDAHALHSEVTMSGPLIGVTYRF